jgi:hypothetical protein
MGRWFEEGTDRCLVVTVQGRPVFRYPGAAGIPLSKTDAQDRESFRAKICTAVT